MSEVILDGEEEEILVEDDPDQGLSNYSIHYSIYDSVCIAIVAELCVCMCAADGASDIEGEGEGEEEEEEEEEDEEDDSLFPDTTITLEHVGGGK